MRQALPEITQCESGKAHLGRGAHSASSGRGGAQNRFSTAPRRNQPADTLLSDFCRENTFLLPPNVLLCFMTAQETNVIQYERVYILN